MKRALLVSVAAGAVIAGTGLIIANPTPSSLPDVQVPAIELSNFEGLDSTAVWLDLFTQTSSSAAGPGVGLPDSGAAAATGDAPLVVIDEQNPSAVFEKILDGMVGSVGKQLNAVTAPGTGFGVTIYPDPQQRPVLDNGY